MTKRAGSNSENAQDRFKLTGAERDRQAALTATLEFMTMFDKLEEASRAFLNKGASEMLVYRLGCRSVRGSIATAAHSVEPLVVPIT
jgi:hypothetical protein